MSSYKIDKQVGHPSMRAHPRASYAYRGSSFMDDTMDDNMGAHVGEDADVKKLTTKLMQADGVKVVIKNGVVTGTALTAEAIEQMKRELPNMNPFQRESALRIIVAYTLAQQGGPGAYVGAIEDDTVVQTVAAVDPTGLVAKALGVKKFISNLFGGMGATIKARKDMMNIAKEQYNATATLMTRFTPAGDLKEVWDWGRVNRAASLEDYKFFKAVWLQSKPDWKTGVPWPEMVDGPWQWLQAPYAKIVNDKTKNNTGGMSNAKYLLGGEGYENVVKDTSGGEATNAFAWVGERAAGLMEAYAKAEAKKVSSKPSAEDLAKAAEALKKSQDPNSQNLGTSITTGQDQLGKTGEQAAVDLSKLSSYPTFTENIPVPANTPFVVGCDVGAVVVRDVIPGDTVKKGEVVKSLVPVTIKNGQVVKVSSSLVQKVWGSTGGKIGVIAGGTAIVIGSGWLIRKLMKGK
jgi:hypothetical protein